MNQLLDATNVNPALTFLGQLAPVEIARHDVVDEQPLRDPGELVDLARKVVDERLVLSDRRHSSRPRVELEPPRQLCIRHGPSVGCWHIARGVGRTVAPKTERQAETHRLDAPRWTEAPPYLHKRQRGERPRAAVATPARVVEIERADAGSAPRVNRAAYPR